MVIARCYMYVNALNLGASTTCTNFATSGPRQVGTKVGKYTISVSLFWVSYFAIIETMASSGSHDHNYESEMTVEGLWSKAHHLS